MGNTEKLLNQIMELKFTTKSLQRQAVISRSEDSEQPQMMGDHEGHVHAHTHATHGLGYVERRIRNYRLELEKRLQQAQARKASLRKIHEQTVLQEARWMVEDMQALNKRLEETVS
ncbi:bax inhibitor 1-like [Hibiscus syriacus]|uniref:Bax inhibitor 1-like n=1 Tax=Hibiscus syriacus TaxID=106335 RepID=A0A6A3AMY7_HIBSY|nr:bax inhibitor 1-like [Hibiscus syriacus]